MTAPLHQRQGVVPFPTPTPPASEVGDGSEHDGCMGCKMIRDREESRYEQKCYVAGELFTRSGPQDHRSSVMNPLDTSASFLQADAEAG